MFEHDPTTHICYECDSEFMVHAPYDQENTVSFCPYCGSEIENEADFDEEVDSEADE